ncbi:MAG: hypothetical protein L3J11_04310 [Draconibacterium sp.]|nr:hypothetical protein [Draconibacterium sp.]
MSFIAENKVADFPNFLLIAGNGRNVGKTFLSCKIIEYLSKKQAVTGIKISPYFHAVEKDKIHIQTNDFIITEETKITQKDSSRLLQAGAQKVYFVMAAQENLKKAFSHLIDILPQTAVVCESGGLHEFIAPGIFLFVKRVGDEIAKPHLLKFSPTIVENDGVNFNLDISDIEFINNRFILQ